MIDPNSRWYVWYVLASLVVLVHDLLESHVVGCAWGAIGQFAPGDIGMIWVDRTSGSVGGVVAFNDYELSLSRQYIISLPLHWSFAQFTLGAMDVEARDTVERVFSIFCTALSMPRLAVRPPHA